MKKTITKLAMAMSIASTAQAQTTVTFDTFTLSANSYYQDNSSVGFTSGETSFHYGWDPQWGGYWESGTSYTNMNDTIDGTYTNLYGCITGTANSGDNYATVKSGAVIVLSNTTTVSGFYITNTTYAWKTIKKGDSFSRRFGDTTGTGSGTSIPQGEYPDWFKVLVRGHRGGNMLTDSVEFYLADYRAAGTANDYAIKNWQFVDCTLLGQVDSLSFEIKSSDNGNFGMNTPGFFSIDDFTTQSTVGINELVTASAVSLFPNPTNQNLFLNYESNSVSKLNISIFNISGKELEQNNTQTSIGKNQLKLNTETLEPGIYFIEITDGLSSKKIKFIKL